MSSTFFHYIIIPGCIEFMQVILMVMEEAIIPKSYDRSPRLPEIDVRNRCGVF